MFNISSSATQTAETFTSEFSGQKPDVSWLAEAASIDRVPDEQREQWEAEVLARCAAPEGERHRLSSGLAEWDGVEVVWPKSVAGRGTGCEVLVDCFVLTGPRAGTTAAVSFRWLAEGQKLG